MTYPAPVFTDEEVMFSSPGIASERPVPEGKSNSIPYCQNPGDAKDNIH